MSTMSSEVKLAFEEVTLAEKIKKNLWAIIALVVIFALAISVLVSSFSKSNYTYNGLVKSDDAKVGLKDSVYKVIFVEDLLCPNCKNYDPSINDAITKYGEKVEFVFKFIEIDAGSKLIIPSVLAANKQNKFREFIVQAYAQQTQVRLSREDTLKTIARSIEGLDYTKWDNDRSYDEEIKKKVDTMTEDLKGTVFPPNKQGAEKLVGKPVNSTPTTILMKDNTVIDWFSGAVSSETLSTSLDELLKK
jgi:protein-disulfide isomerase